VPLRGQATCHRRPDEDSGEQRGVEAERGEVTYVQDEQGPGSRAAEHGGHSEQAAHEGEPVAFALPAAFAFISQWLPSGATVTSLRDAIYFPGYQHARPILVLAAWAVLLFGAMLVASHRRRTSPGSA
jgi:hypothetical protein